MHLNGSNFWSGREVARLYLESGSRNRVSAVGKVSFLLSTTKGKSRKIPSGEIEMGGRLFKLLDGVNRFGQLSGN